MRRIKEYIVVSEFVDRSIFQSFARGQDGITSFQSKVNEKIKEGYEPYGPPSMNSSSISNGLLRSRTQQLRITQAMVRYHE
ncbi:MAG: DUF1737 domain-containing protein [Bacteroidota bacterium]